MKKTHTHTKKEENQSEKLQMIVGGLWAKKLELKITKKKIIIIKKILKANCVCVCVDYIQKTHVANLCVVKSFRIL